MSPRPALHIKRRGTAKAKQQNTTTKQRTSVLEDEVRYRDLFDRTLDGVYLSTHDGRFVDVNPAFVKMFGYSGKEEMLQIKDIKKTLYFSPEERGSHILDTGKEEVDVYRMRRKDGSEIWVEDHGSYIHDATGRILYHQGLLRDVTERARTERLLRESEARYRGLVEQSLVGIGIAHGNRIIFANSALLKMFGYDRLEEFVKTPLLDHVVPKLREVVAARMRNVARGESVPSGFEYEIIRKDGSIRTLQASTVRLLLGNEIYSEGIFQDVTEHKRMEEALRESGMRFRSLTENSLTGIYVIQDGQFTYVNPALAAVFGYTPEELIGAEPRIVIDPEDLALVT